MSFKESRHRARVRRWLVVPVVSPMVMLLPIGPAHAYDCGSFKNGNWHNSFTSERDSFPREDISGVRATIDQRSVKFCSGGKSSIKFSNTYVMLQGNRSVSLSGWMQVGYERQSAANKYPGYRHFAQNFNNQRDASGRLVVNTYYGPKITLGGAKNFKVDAVNSLYQPRVVDALVGGKIVLSGSWGRWQRPLDLEVSQESTYRENDVPGTSANKVTVKSLKYKRGTSGGFYDMPAGVLRRSSDSNRWKKGSPSATTKRFWTDPTN